MQKKRKKSIKNFAVQIIYSTFAHAKTKPLVPWMSGLVNGLQNRVRRFESARHLYKLRNHDLMVVIFCFPNILSFAYWLERYSVLQIDTKSPFSSFIYRHILLYKQ